MNLEAVPWREQPLTTPSPIVEMFGRLGRLVAQGVDMIPLHSGEPDFGPPPVVLEALRAVEASTSRYTLPTGRPELRAAAAEFYGAAHGLPLRPENVCVCAGAKHALTAALQTTVGPGDEVIIPIPAWGNHAALVQSFGASVVPLSSTAANGFLPELEGFEAALSPKTKALLLMSPVNPTGAVWPRELLGKIARVCAERRITIIADVIYREFCYDVPFASPAGIAAANGAPTILIEGLSKAYGIPGYRVGFLISHEKLVTAAASIIGNTVSCSANPSQVAAVAALRGGGSAVLEYKKSLDQRRLRMSELTRSLDGIVLHAMPSGGFFLFVDARKLMGKRGADGAEIRNDLDLVNHLIERARVSAIPGSTFSMPGFIRLSYAATNLARIEEAYVRMRPALAELR